MLCHRAAVTPKIPKFFWVMNAASLAINTQEIASTKDWMTINGTLFSPKVDTNGMRKIKYPGIRSVCEKIPDVSGI